MGRGADALVVAATLAVGTVVVAVVVVALGSDSGAADVLPGGSAAVLPLLVLLVEGPATSDGGVGFSLSTKRTTAMTRSTVTTAVIAP